MKKTKHTNYKSIFKMLIILLVANILQQEVKVQAQETNKSPRKIGLTYSSFGTNDVIRFQELDGAASYNSKNFSVFGLTYIYSLNNWLDIETGLEYAKHTITVNPNLPPDVDDTAYDADLAFLEIPVTVRADFLKFFFVNLGLITDFDISDNTPVDSQTGIGVVGGIGAKYDFKFGLSLFVNPYLKAHALIPFTDNNYQQHMMESGFRFGVTYDLKKK